MKTVASLAALCFATGLAFAFSVNHNSSGQRNPPPASDPDGPITLAEGVNTVLNAGIQQDGQDPPPGNPDTGGGSAFNYCTAAVNSTGFPSPISFVGSLSLANNTFGMQTINLPPHAPSWGMYTYGSVQYNVPFGNGFLCISPFFPGLFKMPTQSLGTGTVVNTMALHPNQFTAFTPGSSWNFQFWYRDPTAGGANFNLSDGLHVDFAP
jgi:hypothetical protein